MKLLHPFTCIVSGPSGSGKSSLIKSIIEENVIKPRPNKIVWLYAEDQPLYKSLKDDNRVEFIKGIPDDLESQFDIRDNNVLILDDLMTQLHSDERLTRLFSVGSHHKNLSVVFIIHNLFHQGKEMRTLSLNSHYIILFKNPRDRLQISTLARQMYPGKSKYLIEAFDNATSGAYGYLLIDLKPTTAEILRIRTGILPQDTQFVYIHKDESTDDASASSQTSRCQNGLPFLNHL